MYPRIPDPPVREDGTTRMDHGFACFRYLVATGITQHVLDPESARAAYHASQYLVTARDIAPAALDCYHAIRAQLAERITNEDRAQAQRERLDAQLSARQARQDDARDGGSKDRQPTPPTRPTPPSSGARPEPDPIGTIPGAAVTHAPGQTWRLATRPQPPAPVAPAPRPRPSFDF